MAYGQTGSGKTFTMGSAALNSNNSSSSMDGIIPRVIVDLFDNVHQREINDPNSTYVIKVQFLEIYGEEIRDLLDVTCAKKVGG